MNENELIKSVGAHELLGMMGGNSYVVMTGKKGRANVLAKHRGQGKNRPGVYFNADDGRPPGMSDEDWAAMQQAGMAAGAAQTVIDEQNASVNAYQAELQAATLAQQEAEIQAARDAAEAERVASEQYSAQQEAYRQEQIAEEEKQQAIRQAEVERQQSETYQAQQAAYEEEQRLAAEQEAQMQTARDQAEAERIQSEQYQAQVVAYEKQQADEAARVAGEAKIEEERQAAIQAAALAREESDRLAYEAQQAQDPSNYLKSANVVTSEGSATVVEPTPTEPTPPVVEQTSASSATIKTPEVNVNVNTGAGNVLGSGLISSNSILDSASSMLLPKSTGGIASGGASGTAAKKDEKGNVILKKWYQEPKYYIPMAVVGTGLTYWAVMKFLLHKNPLKPF